MLTEIEMGFRMSSYQEPLFHEDWRDALRHVVKALGGVETVGAELWPHKTRKAAGGMLSDCLNPDRPNKLDLEEVEALIRMGRDAGVHCGLQILCDRTSYERPQPTTPKSPKALLLEKQAAIAAEAVRLQQEIDRIDGADDLKRVRGL